MLLTTVLVLITIPFWGITFQLPKNALAKDDAVSLLSFNTKLFREKSVYDQFSLDMIKWVVEDTSSIKCIQEFSTNARWPALDIKGQIESSGYHSFDYKASEGNFGDHNPGMAIFSKYPIVDQGVLPLANNGINAIIYADILVGRDTLRVYNIHLTSYHFELPEQSSNFLRALEVVITEAKQVVISHTNEVQTLLEHADECPYPYLIAGDLNESPYSYTYRKLSSMSNAFESTGYGFGFTMIKPPLFLRIDNIFFNQQISMHSFEVDYSMNISDHYPIRASFDIELN